MLKKGALVRLNDAVCFTTKHGGERRFPLTNGANDKAGTVDGTRIATPADKDQYYEDRQRRIAEAQSRGEDTFDITMDSGGESRLPPTAYTVRLHRDRVYTVLRARCCPVWSYRKHPGQALVLCSETGKEVYVKRTLLEVIDESR